MSRSGSYYYHYYYYYSNITAAATIVLFITVPDGSCVALMLVWSAVFRQWLVSHDGKPNSAACCWSWRRIPTINPWCRFNFLDILQPMTHAKPKSTPANQEAESKNGTDLHQEFLQDSRAKGVSECRSVNLWDAYKMQKRNCKTNKSKMWNKARKLLTKLTHIRCYLLTAFAFSFALYTMAAFGRCFEERSIFSLLLHTLYVYVFNCMTIGADRQSDASQQSFHTFRSVIWRRFLLTG